MPASRDRDLDALLDQLVNHLRDTWARMAEPRPAATHARAISRRQGAAPANHPPALPLPRALTDR